MQSNKAVNGDFFYKYLTEYIKRKKHNSLRVCMYRLGEKYDVL
jgi:hypothetical protein